MDKLPKCGCGGEAVVDITRDSKVKISHCGEMVKADTFDEAYDKWVNGERVPYEFDYDDLCDMFDVARENRCDIAVKIQEDGKEPFYVVSNYKSLDYMENMYKNEYTYNLHRKDNSNIKIIEAGAFNSEMFDDFEVQSDNLTFGEAIEALKSGFKVSREGWNGKGQYIELATRISYTTSQDGDVNPKHEDIGNAAIVFVGTRGQQIGWLASQADMLSEDWYIV